MTTVLSRGGAQHQPLGLFRGALVASSLLLLAPNAQAQESYTPAVLRLKETSFFYRTRVAPFNCGDLERRVASLMSALGARHDIYVDASGCESGIDPIEPAVVSQSDSGRRGMPTDGWNAAADPFARTQPNPRTQNAHIRIRGLFPVEVTPEILAEMEKDKSRRELISRVTGNPSATFDDPIVFPAERREVTLSRRTVDLEADECELLDQMSTGLFPKLNIRVVQRGLSCSRDSISRMPPNMIVEALMPIMPSAPKIEPAGESSPGASSPGASASGEPSSGEPESEEAAEQRTKEDETTGGESDPKPE